MRIAVFGSFYRGFYVLSELLKGDLSNFVQVVGVACDDPTKTHVSPLKRVWQYPHTEPEREMVAKLANQHGLEAYLGRVKSAEFYSLMENVWKPDLCIMATFGQKIDARIFEYPRYGFFNLHPCLDDQWPSKYVGGNPFHAMQIDNREYAKIAMHRVDADFDTGELIAYSEKIYLPPHASVTDMHKITAFSAAQLAAREIRKLIVREN